MTNCILLFFLVGTVIISYYYDLYPTYWFYLSFAVVFLANIIILKNDASSYKLITWITMIDLLIIVTMFGKMLGWMPMSRFVDLPILSMIAFFVGDIRCGVIITILVILMITIWTIIEPTDFTNASIQLTDIQIEDLQRLCSPVLVITSYVNMQLSLALMGYIYEVTYLYTAGIVEKLQKTKHGRNFKS